jgi:hypothetical protein
MDEKQFDAFTKQFDDFKKFQLEFSKSVIDNIKIMNEKLNELDKKINKLELKINVKTNNNDLKEEDILAHILYNLSKNNTIQLPTVKELHELTPREIKIKYPKEADELIKIRCRYFNKLSQRRRRARKKINK